jgi:tripartite-type tricarboxylate transporter receptor subunit TctC
MNVALRFGVGMGYRGVGPRAQEEAPLPRSRRDVLRLGACVAVLPATGRMASAQTYASRSVRIVVGVAAGSAQDILSRLIGQWLSERLGQPVLIENRPGAATNHATEAVVRAPADGYTLLSVGPSAAINVTLYDKLSFNVKRDLVPVASLVHQAQVVVVNPAVPAKTIPDFIAYNKANPRKINLASSGVGTGNHLAGELFNMLAGVQMVHVPYRGAGPAMADLVGGQVQVMFVTPVVAVEHIAAGKVRALAVTTATRADVMPGLPAVGDFVPGYESSAWFGIMAPKGTPAEIVLRLNREINAGLTDRALRSKIDALGGGIVAGSPADFGELIADETEKWGKVVKFAGIKPE